MQLRSCCQFFLRARFVISIIKRNKHFKSKVRKVAKLHIRLASFQQVSMNFCFKAFLVEVGEVIEEGCACRTASSQLKCKKDFQSPIYKMNRKRIDRTVSSQLSSPGPKPLRPNPIPVQPNSKPQLGLRGPRADTKILRIP